jgi:hypothetical protein
MTAGRLAVLVICCFSVLLFAGVSRALAAYPGAACPLMAPQEQPEARRGYADPAGSVPNERNRAMNRQAASPLRDFIGSIGSAADGSGPLSGGCAVENLDRWAAAGALLQGPDSFAAHRQQLRYALGLNIATAKLIAGGARPGAGVDGWLQQLTMTAVAPFRREGNSIDTVNNLYVWSGVVAASALLIGRNPEALQYQQQVWQNATAAIGPDGVVRAELRRGARSLSYHAYYLSALLWLQRLRAHLGLPATPDELAAVTRLEGLLERSVCEGYFPAAGVPQIRPTVPAYKSVLFFADPSVTGRLQSCGLRPAPGFDAFLGGDINATLRLLNAPPR